MKTISTRELCSLIFLIYGNIHLILSYVFDVCASYLFIAASGYTVIDTLWLLVDEDSKTPKHELVSHHISTVILLMSSIDTDTKLKVMIIEFSTMFLMLRRCTMGIMKRVMHILFMSTWVTTRVIWLYCLLISLKITGKFEIYNTNPLEFLSYIIVYLLSVKWTVESLGLVKYRSYTSIWLGLPIYLLPNTLSNQQFIAIFNLLIGSFIHHLMRNRISLAIDSFNINFTCLTYLGNNPYTCTVIGALSSIEVLARNEHINFLTRMIYSYTLLHHCCIYDPVVVIAFLISSGYYKYQRYNKTGIWHLANGLYLSYVTEQLALLKNT
jgi:hypothetical protein